MLNKAKPHTAPPSYESQGKLSAIQRANMPIAPGSAPLSGIPAGGSPVTRSEAGKIAPVMRPDTQDPKAQMRRQMMAQLLMQQPFQNPQIARPQFQLYSQGY